MTVFERVFGEALNRYLRRPALSWICLIVALAANGLAYVIYRAFLPALSERDDAGLYFLVYIGCALLLDVLVFLVRSRAYARAMFLVRIALLAGIFGTASLRSLVGILVTAPLILEISLYESFPANFMAGAACSILFALVAVGTANDGVTYPRFGGMVLRVLDGGTYLSVILLLSFSMSLVTKYRERIVSQQSEIARLDHAVSSLASANLGYQEYASRAAELSMAEERKRITREIHDTIAYTMTNNIMMMEAATDMVRRDPGRVASLLHTARESAERGLDEIRNALHLLRAQEMPAESCATAIARLVRIFELATRVRVRLELGNLRDDLSVQSKYVVYHFVQEALTNSFRHGRATRVTILFWQEHGDLSVSVWDDGRGAHNIQEGIGMTGMKERLRKVSGSLSVDNRLGGFQVTATIPIPGPQE